MNLLVEIENMKEFKSLNLIPDVSGGFGLMQIGIFDWLAQNTFMAVGIFFILFVVILVIYFKLFVRIIYEGTTYRHYRKGRLMREGDKGGTIFLLPFFDKLEIIPPTEPNPDSFDDTLFE